MGLQIRVRRWSDRQPKGSNTSSSDRNWASHAEDGSVLFRDEDPWAISRPPWLFSDPHFWHNIYYSLKRLDAVILAGGSGSGKSVAIRSAALYWIQRWQEDKAEPFALYCKATELAEAIETHYPKAKEAGYEWEPESDVEGIARALASLALGYLSDLSPEDANWLKDRVERLIKAGEALLFVDGLDECRVTYKLDLLITRVALETRSKLILSSRPYALCIDVIELAQKGKAFLGEVGRLTFKRQLHYFETIGKRTIGEALAKSESAYGRNEVLSIPLFAALIGQREGLTQEHCMRILCNFEVLDLSVQGWDHFEKASQIALISWRERAPKGEPLRQVQFDIFDEQAAVLKDTPWLRRFVRGGSDPIYEWTHPRIFEFLVAGKLAVEMQQEGVEELIRPLRYDPRNWGITSLLFQRLLLKGNADLAWRLWNAIVHGWDDSSRSGVLLGLTLLIEARHLLGNLSPLMSLTLAAWCHEARTVLLRLQTSDPYRDWVVEINRLEHALMPQIKKANEQDWLSLLKWTFTMPPEYSIWAASRLPKEFNGHAASMIESSIDSTLERLRTATSEHEEGSRSYVHRDRLLSLESLLGRLFTARYAITPEKAIRVIHTAEPLSPQLTYALSTGIPECHAVLLERIRNAHNFNEQLSMLKLLPSAGPVLPLLIVPQLIKIILSAGPFRGGGISSSRFGSTRIPFASTVTSILEMLEQTEKTRDKSQLATLLSSICLANYGTKTVNFFLAGHTVDDKVTVLEHLDAYAQWLSMSQECISEPLNGPYWESFHWTSSLSKLIGERHRCALWGLVRDNDHEANGVSSHLHYSRRSFAFQLLAELGDAYADLEIPSFLTGTRQDKQLLNLPDSIGQAIWELGDAWISDDLGGHYQGLKDIGGAEAATAFLLAWMLSESPAAYRFAEQHIDELLSSNGPPKDPEMQALLKGLKSQHPDENIPEPGDSRAYWIAQFVKKMAGEGYLVDSPTLANAVSKAIELDWDISAAEIISCFGIQERCYEILKEKFDTSVNSGDLKKARGFIRAVAFVGPLLCVPDLQSFAKACVETGEERLLLDVIAATAGSREARALKPLLWSRLESDEKATWALSALVAIGDPRVVDYLLPKVRKALSSGIEDSLILCQNAAIVDRAKTVQFLFDLRRDESLSLRERLYLDTMVTELGASADIESVMAVMERSSNAKVSEHLIRLITGRADERNVHHVVVIMTSALRAGNDDVFLEAASCLSRMSCVHSAKKLEEAARWSMVEAPHLVSRLIALCLRRRIDLRHTLMRMEVEARSRDFANFATGGESSSGFDWDSLSLAMAWAGSSPSHGQSDQDYLILEVPRLQFARIDFAKNARMYDRHDFGQSFHIWELAYKPGDQS